MMLTAKKNLFTPILVAFVSLLWGACTGLTLGENKPGDDTYLEGGAIAVDPIRDFVYVLKKEADGDAHLDSGTQRRTLYQAHPDSAVAQPVFSREGHADLRMLFPGSALLMMEQVSEYQERLSLVDPHSFATLREVHKSARYHGTRLSPSGRFLVVADNANIYTPVLHVVDTRTLEHIEIPHEGEWLEAMWLNHQDVLVASVFYDKALPSARARILAWSFESIGSDKALNEIQSQWGAPLLDLVYDGVVRDWSMSFTWVGVSPDDDLIVIPVQESSEEGREGRHVLLFVNLLAGTIHKHDDARGPVGFTPDGSTLISYRNLRNPSGPGATKVVLIHRDSHHEEILELPYESGPQYFVTREGHFLVIAPNPSSQGNLMVYDFDTEQMKTVPGPSVHITQFVSRLGSHELWLIDEGLYRFDFLEQKLEAAPINWVPEHINILYDRDLLVLDDALSDRLIFYDLKQEEVLREVSLTQGLGPVL